MDCLHGADWLGCFSCERLRQLLQHRVRSNSIPSLSNHKLHAEPSAGCAGRVLNYAGVTALTPAEVSARAARVLRFIDLGGHERYLKTALFGACAGTVCQHLAERVRRLYNLVRAVRSASAMRTVPAHVSALQSAVFGHGVVGATSTSLRRRPLLK